MSPAGAISQELWVEKDETLYDSPGGKAQLKIAALIWFQTLINLVV